MPRFDAVVRFSAGQRGIMAPVSSAPHSSQPQNEPPRIPTPQELHARQRELVRQSLSLCPGAKHTPTHRRWA